MTSHKSYVLCLPGPFRKIIGVRFDFEAALAGRFRSGIQS